MARTLQSHAEPKPTPPDQHTPTETGLMQQRRILVVEDKEQERQLLRQLLEGPALVIDTVGFNEKFWMDREGSPHTEKLHFIERFTRLDMNSMKYEITIDDPGAYTATWNTGSILRWSPGQELFEYVCQDNNHAPELMLGNEKSVDRSSVIIP